MASAVGGCGCPGAGRMASAECGVAGRHASGVVLPLAHHVPLVLLQVVHVDLLERHDAAIRGPVEGLVAEHQRLPGERELGAQRDSGAM
eukprot:9182386-Heterocapsa_arctica.AAC.1